MMLNKFNWLYRIILITIIVFPISFNLKAQNNMHRDIIYLKNGFIIEGIIIEQIPNISYKIETLDGNIFVYSADEVKKITKENIQTQSVIHNSRIGGTIGISTANEGGILNPGYCGSIFYHHILSKKSFLSVNVGLQYYSADDNISISVSNIPITIGFNSLLLYNTNTFIYIGLELGMLIEKGTIAGYTGESYYSESEDSSSFIFQPVLGASIPLSKLINLDCNIKPMFATESYEFYYSTAINIGISFKLQW